MSFVNPSNPELHGYDDIEFYGGFETIKGKDVGAPPDHMLVEPGEIANISAQMKAHDAELKSKKAEAKSTKPSILDRTLTGFSGLKDKTIGKLQEGCKQQFITVGRARANTISGFTNPSAAPESGRTRSPSLWSHPSQSEAGEDLTEKDESYTEKELQTPKVVGDIYKSEKRGGLAKRVFKYPVHEDVSGKKEPGLPFEEEAKVRIIPSQGRANLNREIDKPRTDTTAKLDNFVTGRRSKAKGQSKLSLATQLREQKEIKEKAPAVAKQWTSGEARRHKTTEIAMSQVRAPQPLTKEQKANLNHELDKSREIIEAGRFFVDDTVRIGLGPETMGRRGNVVPEHRRLKEFSKYQELQNLSFYPQEIAPKKMEALSKSGLFKEFKSDCEQQLKTMNGLLTSIPKDSDYYKEVQKRINHLKVVTEHLKGY